MCPLCSPVTLDISNELKCVRSFRNAKSIMVGCKSVRSSKRLKNLSSVYRDGTLKIYEFYVAQSLFKVCVQAK
jgi:hypothetical protein